MGILTFTIGRGHECEISLDHPTVSRRHAELVAGEGGIYYLTDCASTFGTFRVTGSDWEPIKQCYVQPSDRVRLGEYQTTVSALLEVADRPPSLDRSTEKIATGPLRDIDDRPVGKVRRDPISGEILAD